MESAKHGNSDSSSEENDQKEKVNDDNTGTGRSYECTFCKRGFTNAQALGGHMNIHRKDKAKAKQLNTESSLPNKSTEEHMSSKISPPISSQHGHYYGALGAQMNYQMYFPGPNPNSPHAYHHHHHHGELTNTPKSNSLSLHEEGMDANLSLRIGPPESEDGKGKKKEKKKGRKENEVDLELRLGHDP